MCGGWDLMVSKSSTRKRETMDFVEYLLSEEAQTLLYEESGFFPVVRSFYSDVRLRSNHPEIADIGSLMSTGVHRPSDKNYTNYSEIMAHFFHRALKNEITVDAAVEGATNAIIAQHATVEAR